MQMRGRLKGDWKKIMRMREKELKRVDKATAMALERFGAIIRQDSKRAIGSPAKPKKTGFKMVDGKRTFVHTPASPPRPPGQPPRSRTSHEIYSLRNIRYIVNYSKRFVRIGPWNTSGKRYGSRTVADLQEFGGTINTKVMTVRSALTMKNLKKLKDGTLTQVSSRVQVIETKYNGKPATIKIPKRPFMRPSYQKHKKKATKIWRDYYKAQRGKR